MHGTLMAQALSAVIVTSMQLSGQTDTNSKVNPSLGWNALQSKKKLQADTTVTCIVATRIISQNDSLV